MAHNWFVSFTNQFIISQPIKSLLTISMRFKEEGTDGLFNFINQLN